MSTLDDLMSSLPGYSAVTEGMKKTALAGALIPDTEGVWPGQEDYKETHDEYYAALTLLGFLQAQPAVTHTSSEGTSLSVSRPDWAALAKYYQSQSSIVQEMGTRVLTRVVIPDVPHVKPTDMTGRGTRYGDIDTDVG